MGRSVCAWGRSVDAPQDESPSTPALQFGTCALADDPTSAPAGFVACVRGRAGAEVTTVSGALRENFWIRYGSAYLGAHFGEWASVHVRGEARDVVPYADGTSESLDRRLDYGVLQIGNPALHHVWLDAGRQRLPFGIDQSHVVETYRMRENRRFWASPEHGLALSLDDQKRLRFDVGYANDVLSGERRKLMREHVEPLPQETHAFSGRLTLDLSALDGSRVVLSGYGENRGERRLGAGFLTTSRKGDLTQFEFVRLLTTPDGSEAPFEQLLRAGYLGAWRDDTRWVVQVDDQRRVERAGLIGVDVRLFDVFALRLAGTYVKSESGDRRRRWYVTSGLEAQL
jgi:hypothetical protein